MAFKFRSILFRVIMIWGLAVLGGILVTRPDTLATNALVLTVLLAMLIELALHGKKILYQFQQTIESAQHGDFSSQIDIGFGALGPLLARVAETNTNRQHQQKQKMHQLSAIVELAPTPLLSIGEHGQLVLWNRAARQLFQKQAPKTMDDLKDFGDEFATGLASLKTGDRRIVSLTWPKGGTTRLLATCRTATIGGNEEKLIALDDVEKDLNDARLDTSRNLIRVLSHEILGSLTPIASLSATNKDLANQMTKNQSLDILPQLVESLDTVSRRTESLLSFAQNYQSLTKLALHRQEEISLAHLFNHFRGLFDDDSQMTLDCKIHMDAATVIADQTLLSQALMNLIQNAREAQPNACHTLVRLVSQTAIDGGVMIEVHDNGPGITDSVRRQAFLPFYTTKKQGSGIGLALVDQTMTLHAGTVSVGTSPLGGACFRLHFPIRTK